MLCPGVWEWVCPLLDILLVASTYFKQCNDNLYLKNRMADGMAPSQGTTTPFALHATLVSVSLSGTHCQYYQGVCGQGLVILCSGIQLFNAPKPQVHGWMTWLFE
jgi:hypothetical protein